MRSINEERKENDCKNIIELYIKIAKQYKSMTNKERLRVEDIIYEEYGEIEDEDIILERRLEFLISAKKKYNKGDIVEKEKYTIPKEFHDKKITEQSKHMTTNKEKLQELEDILIRNLEGLSNFVVLERRLKLILLIEQIKDITK